jgi:hypothetical protein
MGLPSTPREVLPASPFWVGKSQCPALGRPEEEEGNPGPFLDSQEEDSSAEFWRESIPD